MDDQSTETATDHSYHHDGGRLSMNRKIVVIILSALLVATTAFLIIYIWPIISHYIRRAIPVSKVKIDRRNRTIDQWVICKPVEPHDKTCIVLQHMEDRRLASLAAHAKTMGEAHKNTSVQSPNHQVEPSPPPYHHPSPKSFCNRLSPIDVTEHDDDLDHEHDETEQECSICLEIFNVGDKVSWSINEECEHVFHHECIKGWLLSHVNCPFCRRLYMPVDASTEKLSQDKLKEMAVEKKKRWERTYFCVEDGLCLVGPFSKKDLQQGSIAGTLKGTGRVNAKNGGTTPASTTQGAPTYRSVNSSNRNAPSENDTSPADDEEEEIVFVRDEVDPSYCEMGLGGTLTSEETSEDSTVSSDDSSPVDEEGNIDGSGCENETDGNNNNNTQDVLSYRDEHPSHLEITTTEMGDGNLDVNRKHSKESPPRFMWRRSNRHVSSRMSDIEACTSGSAAEEKPSLGDPLSFDHEERRMGPEICSNV